jgi:hypothetical protein
LHLRLSGWPQRFDLHIVLDTIAGRTDWSSPLPKGALPEQLPPRASWEDSLRRNRTNGAEGRSSRLKGVLDLGVGTPLDNDHPAQSAESLDLPVTRGSGGIKGKGSGTCGRRVLLAGSSQGN